MVVPVTVEQYTKGGDVYYRYYSPYVGHRYAEGSFAAKGMTYEQAKEEAARKSAKYLDIPLYEISGYEHLAPEGVVIGQAAYEKSIAAEASRQRLEALRASREELKTGYAGVFQTEYAQRMAESPIGSAIPTKQEFLKAKFLASPTAQWVSEREFALKAEQYAKYAPFAGVTEFRGQIVSPIAMVSPSYQYESPFGKGLIRKEHFPGALPQTPIGREKLTTMPLFREAAKVSRGVQAGVDIGISKLLVPEAAKETARGFTGMFTGLPEFFASGISGIELAARKPEALKSYIVPAIKEFGVGIAEQARERPAYTAGQLLGMAAMGKGTKVSKPSLAGVKALAKSEAAVSYVPTYERMPVAKPKPLKIAVVERPKGYVLPSLKGLEVAKAITAKPKLTPLTQLKVITETKTAQLVKPIVSTKTQVRTLALPKIRTQTLPMVMPKTRALTATRPATKTMVKFKPMTRTLLQTMPLTRTQVKPMVMPATKTLTKTLVQTRTVTKVMPMTKLLIDVRRPTKIKLAPPKTSLKISTKSKKGYGKFGELAGVASVKRFLTGRL